MREAGWQRIIYVSENPKYRTRSFVEIWKYKQSYNIYTLFVEQPLLFWGNKRKMKMKVFPVWQTGNNHNKSVTWLSVSLHSNKGDNFANLNSQVKLYRRLKQSVDNIYNDRRGLLHIKSPIFPRLPSQPSHIFYTIVSSRLAYNISC